MKYTRYYFTITLILILVMLLPFSFSLADDFSVTVTCWGEEYKINYGDCGGTDDNGGWVYLTGDKPMMNGEKIDVPMGVVVGVKGEKIKPYKATAAYQDGVVHYVFYYDSDFFFNHPEAVWIWPEGDEKREVLLWPSSEDRLDEKFEIITFGNYEQDNDLSNGPEPIEWLVLEKDDKKALLVSRKVLDYGKYHNKYEEVTWEKCSIRQWLNSEFLDTAFTDEERAKILTVTVTADAGRYSKADQGNDTEDKVFLLSYAETEQYFKSDEDRQCLPTAYAIERGVTEYYTGRSSWTLRSISANNKEVTSVTSKGKISDHVTVNRSDHVRPAIVLNISELGD